MNKYILWGSVCLSCAAVILSGCKKEDDFMDGEEWNNIVYSTYRNPLKSDGDTIKIVWAKDVAYEYNINSRFNIYSCEWVYQRSITSLVGTTVIARQEIYPEEKEEVTMSGDTIMGEWFTVFPIVSAVYQGTKFYNGVKVAISPNNTGKRRMLEIHPDSPHISNAIIFQEAEEQTPKLPVFKYFDGAEFDSLFVSSTWTVNGIYDVDKNGNLSKNILTTIYGLGILTIDPAENGAVRFRHQPTDPNQTETVTDAAYTFQTANWLTFDKTVAPCPQTLKVLEITDKQMRCLGEVYDKAQSPNAIKGLYVFKRQLKE